MYGHATFKSHVLRRDEKGVFGIPFKRLLGCGLGAGALFTLLRVVIPGYALVIGLLCLVLLLVYTTPRGGIPRYQHIAYQLRWMLLSARTLTPDSLAGQIGHALGLPAEQIDIDAERLFTLNEDEAPRTALTDWVTFNSPIAEAETGLTFAHSPGLVLHGEGS